MGRGQWKLKNGGITIARFDGIDGVYHTCSKTNRTVPILGGIFTNSSMIANSLNAFANSENKSKRFVNGID